MKESPTSPAYRAAHDHLQRQRIFRMQLFLFLGLCASCMSLMSMRLDQSKGMQHSAHGGAAYNKMTYQFAMRVLIISSLFPLLDIKLVSTYACVRCVAPNKRLVCFWRDKELGVSPCMI